MFDPYNRHIHYLRVSVTDRCNLRCVYCMPEEGIPLMNHDDVLRYEKILKVVKEAVSLGIDKVRITGGEPLVRKGIENLVSMIAGVEGVKDLGLTTNGILLEEYAEKLAAAGLHRINISLDTLDPEKFRALTRGGDITRVLRGITAAQKAGLTPVKINCVVKKSSAEPDAQAVREFGRENGLVVRFIQQMSLENGCFSVVEGGSGGHCSGCNRLRLTANGFIKPCLFSDIQFSIHEYGIRDALLKAIQYKPEKGSINTQNSFNNIGG
jgi:GTP 3',8-cyclase